MTQLPAHLARADRYFKGTKYEKDLEELHKALEVDDFMTIQAVSDRFPTRAELFTNILETLSRPKPKGKPIYKTLVRLAKGEVTDLEEKIMAYFSLGVHLSIEIQKGNKEYRMLRDECYEKLGSLIYQDSSKEEENV